MTAVTRQPSAEDLFTIRRGAELTNYKPYLDVEIQAMQKAVVSSVLAAVSNGNLTAEMALSKWMEYIAYQKLAQKFEQRIQVGIAIGAKQNLDIQE